MAASADKAILFAKASHNRQPHMWPVAAFNTERDARNYAAFLKMAYGTGNQEAIKALDPAALRDDAGLALPGTKWSIKVVPYAPVPNFGDDAVEEDVPSST